MTQVRGVDLRTEPARSRPDLTIVVITVALTALGLIMILSASAPRLEAEGASPNSQMLRQLIFVVIGAAGMFGASLVSDRGWRMVTPLVYVGTMVLLLVVLSPLGTVRQGAQRWLSFGFIDLQPSELAKPAVILALAVLLTPDGESHIRWPRIAKVAALVVAPSALIFLQPDLGTMLVFGFVTLAMLFVAGTSMRQLAIITVGGLLLLLTVVELGILRDYQVERLTGFLNPAEQTLSTNYNQNQSQITIGSGGMFGTGLFNGAQTNLSFVPAQTTDFIFTALAEQLGFVGGALVIGLYAVLIWRLLVISMAARDRFGQLVTVGIASMFGFHVFINIGMTLGLLPVTGLPLPFISFGGSFYLSMAVSLGIANAIWMNRSPVPGDRRVT
jgi:rod shape determining protein RodA